MALKIVVDISVILVKFLLDQDVKIFVVLAKPMFHVGFISKIVQILRCVCCVCSTLKANINDPKIVEVLKLSPKFRFAEIHKICSSPFMECPLCSFQNPKISRDGVKIMAEHKLPEGGLQKKEISAEEVLSTLKNISDKDCIRLGLNPILARPNWMVLTVLAIPPPQVRPTEVSSKGKTSEDDLTVKLADIIKTNNHLEKLENSGAPQHVIREIATLLQFHIATYLNNDIPEQISATTVDGQRCLVSLCERLNGKEGRIRGNLMGKRVQFSGGSIVSPDPNIPTDSVGIPVAMAKRLTIPEIVNSLNINELRDRVVNGPNILPGALFVVRENGDREDLQFVNDRKKIQLFNGDRVERHMKDGDVVLVNRQPAIHKTTTMAHKVKIMPFPTIRLNPLLAVPYTLDFGGDEINIHVPQSLETQAEIMELTMVQNQFVSPKDHRPILGLGQDALLGVTLFTRRDTFLEKATMMNLLMQIPDWNGKVPIPTILKPVELWTGKQIFSLLLPKPNMAIYANTRRHFPKEIPFFSVSDTEVIIENGEILAGIIERGLISRYESGLVHIIWLDHGAEFVENFLFLSQKLINSWLCDRGFTIGFGDVLVEKKFTEKKTEIMKSTKEKIDSLIKDLHRGLIVPRTRLSLMETFEKDLDFFLDQAVNQATFYESEFQVKENNINVMVNSGSKGSSMNITQIRACVGQQKIRGKRIPFGFQRRTLPHFCKDDDGLASRGFVESSFFQGLNPHEFFFHSMSSHAGQIDASAEIPVKSYIQRRLVKAMEDIMVQYDGTVRNSFGDVLQFLYGEDGIDGNQLWKQSLDSFVMNDKKLEVTFKYDFGNSSIGLGERVLDPDILESTRFDSEARDILDREYDQIKEDRNFLRFSVFPDLIEDKVPLPVNLKRLVFNMQKEFQITSKSISDIPPHEIVKKVLTSPCLLN